MLKIAQVVPLISDVKRKLAGFAYYARFDMAAGFNAVVLHESCRDVLAIRTPLGLYRPTRLPFGPKNNPSQFQKVVESLVNASPAYGKNIFVYLDDILVGANAEADLIQFVAIVAHGVGQRGGTLKPSKIRIGYTQEVILGSEISAFGIRPSPAHVQAVQDIALPQNSSEMRSVIGLFTYFFEHFQNFSERMAPLHHYARDGVVFPSPLPQNVLNAISDFKRDMQSQPLLVPFDPGQQLYIDTDASLVALGSCLYHRAHDGSRRAIAYFSKKFTSAESAWAPYVREAFGLAWTLQKATDFVQAAQMTPIVFIDQKPLLWLNKARSPKVVRWVVEILQELDFKLLYRPGPQNLAADAFSRVPCVSPGVPTDVGVVVAVQRLLDMLPLPSPSDARHVLWLSVPGRDSALFHSMRQRNRRILDTAPTTNAFAAQYDFAILVPDETKAPLIARKLLLGKTPFAVLIPIDLMHLIYSPMGDNDLASDHVLAKQKLWETRKLVFSQDNLIWVVSPTWPGVFQNEVFHTEALDDASVRKDWAGMFYSTNSRASSSNEVLLAEGLAPDMRTLKRPPSREALLVAQEADLECQTWNAELTESPSTIVLGGCVVRGEDGLLVFRSDADPDQASGDLLVLPLACRRDVIFYAHRQKNHAREERLADFLSRTYWWPTLRADVKTNLLDCHFCLVARARRLMAHQEYSSMKLTAPHQGYGLDIWGPTIVSSEGYRYVLTIVDLFHGYVRFYPMRTKSAKEIMSTALNMLWWHSGLPNFILTDDDSNFRSELCTEFCRLSNIETWRTAPYSPWELGRVERRHQDLNLAMKALLDKESWPHHLPGPTANAFNTLKSSVTGVAPAEVEYGLIPRGPMEQFSSFSIAEPSATDREQAAEDRTRLDHHIAALRDSQRVFTQLALHHGERHRQAAVDRKNKEAKLVTRKFEVGDLVVVRRPKKVKGIPSKALIQWRGPYTITAISARGYICSHEDGSSVTVSRPDISIYTASSPLASDILQLEAAQPSNVPEFEPGQVLAIADHLPEEQGSNLFQLAKFLNFSDDDPDWVQVEYLGTLKRDPPYRFQNVWIDGKDGKAILRKAKPPPGRTVSADVSRWTGTDPTAQILKLNLELTATGALTADSLRALGTWKPVVIH